MLVLTRKPGQSIMIGDDVEVQILSVAGDKVRIGISAPRDVGIFRDEVYDRIEADRDLEPEPAPPEPAPRAPKNGNGNGTGAPESTYQRVPFEG